MECRKTIEEEARDEVVLIPHEKFLQNQEDLEDLRELRREREETMDMQSGNLREIGRELGFK
jgi:hypothetical protein